MTGKEDNREFFEDELTSSEDSNENQIAGALSDLIQELRSDENIDFFTDLSTREIRHISVLSIRSDETTEEFLENYKALQNSRRRKGREELIEIAKAIGSLANKDERQGLKDKLGIGN